ncbi:Uncharacterised protein [Salmonella enterica subsp. enterica]|uniref:Uncharacterized protein n=1 Tax=Salmonella enterica I TaxID=59201 RepID=A0A3S4LQ25_SALET|nr:Uncharacterised protein [Salmonella enterica subsp. enterica]
MSPTPEITQRSCRPFLRREHRFVHIKDLAVDKVSVMEVEFFRP